MPRILVIGGAGFIGSNLSDYFLVKGNEVKILDNLSRRGTEKNINWLKSNHSGHYEFIKADIRDYVSLCNAVRDVDIIYDLAGQVAVTTSVRDPREDFEVNALGTLNALEAIRNNNPDAVLVFTSTNKVYGKMEDISVIKRDGHYDYDNLHRGVSEKQPLDFYSPYGCSKGAADQYVLDYARICGLKTAVFRMSCIYGIRQFGNEDQGWVAHFIISSIFDRPLTIFGDGKQVRDILFIDDLVRAFDLVAKNIGANQGQVYNIGGGRENVISLLELIEILQNLSGKQIEYSFDDWRPGDQKVYISNIQKAQKDFNWSPVISKQEGIKHLYNWVEHNRELFD